MTFGIVIDHERKKIHLTVTRIEATAIKELWQVRAKNGLFTLITNRPNIRNRGLKHKRAIWAVKDGKAPTTYLIDKITAAIEASIPKE